MTFLTPKTNMALFGHADAEATLSHDYATGKLAHGWIIGGPRGIGKATLAYRFARMLLAGDKAADLHENHPIFLRIAGGSHSDMLVVEQLFDEKKDEKARDISVEQAREIAKFLSLTPGEGQWRVVIIDSVDNLNNNGANAILKILEEPPPQTILMLISHNPGRLLPTIRSRCRSLRLKDLNKQEFTSVMRHVMPGIDSVELRALAQLSAMAPGIALDLHEQGAVTLYAQIIELLSEFPKLDLLMVHAFADQLTGGENHSNWQLFTRLVLCLFERVALQAAEIESDPISDEETHLLRRLAALHPAAVWAAKWQQVAEQFMVTERLHLDYKQVIIAFFHSIASTEGFQIGNAA